MTKKPTERIVFTIESITVIKILVLVAGFLLALSFIKNISHPVVLIFVSFFLALALNPAVSWISNKLKSKSRIRATGMAYVLVIGFLVAFFSLVIPPLVKQTADFIKEVPSTIQDFKNEDTAVSRFIYKYNIDDQLDELSSNIGEKAKHLGKPALSTAGVIGTTLISIVTVLVLTFMMLVEGPIWLEKIWEVQPARKRQHRKELAQRMYKVVVAYVNGQVLIAAIGGMFAAIALFIMSTIFDASVNAIALGGIITLFALLPLIGTTIGASIVVLACLFVSTPLAIAMAIYFLIYQQIENVTIQPYIQARGNNLTPLIVFVAALLGVGFGGILGAFVAIPAAGCIKILLEDHYNARSPEKAEFKERRPHEA